MARPTQPWAARCHSRPDPTPEVRLGDDVERRSLVFGRGRVQAAALRNVVAQRAVGQRRAAPIVTRIEGGVTCWPAGSGHVNEDDHNPMRPCCMPMARPKIDSLRRLFATRIEPRVDGRPIPVRDALPAIAGQPPRIAVTAAAAG